MKKFLTLLLFVTAVVHAFERPAYNRMVRYEEDWSPLACENRCETGDFYDPYKYMPLNHDGSIWLSVGANARMRSETVRHSDLKLSTVTNNVLTETNDTYLFSRIHSHADLHVGPCLRFFVQLQSDWISPRMLTGGRRAIDVDSLDFLNTFVSYQWRPLTFRFGRQEFLFGLQRLLSPSDDRNVPRSFDGGSIIHECGSWKTTAFVTRQVRLKKYHLDDSASNDNFYGAYAVSKSAELYWLGRSVRNATYNGTTGYERRQTIGSRLFGKICEKWDYEGEVAYQFGEVGNATIRAYMWAAYAGYQFKEHCWKPHFWLGYNYASGDKENDGPSVETFSQLFPIRTSLGRTGVIGRQNVIAINPFMILTPTPKLLIIPGYFAYWRASTNDAVYSGVSTVTRAASPLSSASFVGQEADLFMRYYFDLHWIGTAILGVFMPGTFIKQSAATASSTRATRADKTGSLIQFQMEYIF